MAHNTKKLETDVDGKAIPQYYNKETDQYEPLEGRAGASKVITYDSNGEEVNFTIPISPILDKLNNLVGTAIDEEHRKANETARISAESARGTAETERLTDEATRKLEEVNRETNELERDLAESERALNEDERIVNEQARELAESDRAEKDSERDGKIEAVEGLQADLISGAVDSAAVQQHVEERYGQLEEEYAPKLTEVTAQLAQNERYNIDGIDYKIKFAVVNGQPRLIYKEVK